MIMNASINPLNDISTCRNGKSISSFFYSKHSIKKKITHDDEIVLNNEVTFC